MDSNYVDLAVVIILFAILMTAVWRILDAFEYYNRQRGK